METMRFRETKKSSYKGQIFLIIFFLLVGGGITYFAISNEKQPTLIGSSQSDITNKSNLVESDALVDVEGAVVNASDIYSIANKTISDTTTKKIKANITLPVITLNKELLTALNDEIYNKFNVKYNTFKETMQNNVQNNYTYTVTYSVYENVVDNKNIVSITLYERMKDDSTKNTNSMENIYAYNIDLSDGKVLSQDDVVIDILGSTYKDIIKSKIKNHVINNCNVSENDYNYSYTGLETFYIKENKFHLVFNAGDLVKEYQDITIN